MINTNISGLELFQMPFSSHSATQAGAPQQQSGRQTAVQQPVAQKPLNQAEKPTATAVHKPGITPPKCNTAEIQHAVSADETKAPSPAEADKMQTDLTEKEPSPAKPEEQPKDQQKELILDMSSGSVASASSPAASGDDTAKRKAHEAAEAKRRAEWEAKRQEKKQAEEAEINKLQEMSNEEAIAASIKRIGTDTERLTRRNMKECVAEHIQDLCRKDPAFARKTMHPHKNMINCFKYINRQARDYVRQEMEDNDIKPDNGGYGCDVPDGLCCQWAEDYFNDPDAPEDQKKEETFIPKPYTNTTPKTKKAASKTKKEDKTAKKKKDKTKQESSGSFQQMSLF